MKRALLVALPAVLAVGLVACGDDDDNTSATAANTTTVTTSATSATESTSEPDATSGGGVITLPGGGTIDIGSILPGGTIASNGTVPNVEDLIRRIAPNLTDDQVSCLADHIEGERVEMSQIMSIMGECGIDMQDLIGG